MKSQQVVANDRPATRDIAAADTSAARDFRHASARGNRRDCRRARITIAVKKRVGEAASLCQAGDISRDGMLLAKAFEGLYGELPRCWLEFNLPGSDVTISARAYSCSS